MFTMKKRKWVTKSVFAFRYKGYYYIRHIQSDFNCCQTLVNAIPVSLRQFEKWLQSQRNLCETMSSAETIGTYEKSTSPPETNGLIESTYTYDLDNLAFVVDSGAHFDLRAIAHKRIDEWISWDARGRRYLSSNTPPTLVAKLAGNPVPFLGEDSVTYEDQFVPTSTISPSTWSQPLTPHHQRLLLAQVNLSIAESYSKLATFPSLTTASVDVQIYAMSFLEAVVPNNQVIVTNLRSQPFNDDPAPLGGRPWFWYRGCLVLVASELDNEEFFRVYVQAVAARAKAKNLDRCTAILWSIHHVAVVEVSGDTVSHSDPFPLLAVYGSDLDEDDFLNALHLLWHYLPYPRWRVVETSQTPVTFGFGVIPTEIVMKIMAFTDQLHYPKYQFVSRNFFKMWWKHLRVGSLTILPDAGGEVGDTSRCFSAYSADLDLRVDLRLKVLWGKESGNIWRIDEWDEDDSPLAIWDCQEDIPRDARDYLEFRVQRFCSFWPDSEDLICDVSLPTAPSDCFSSLTDILVCEAKPM